MGRGKRKRGRQIEREKEIEGYVKRTILRGERERCRKKGLSEREKER